MFPTYLELTKKLLVVVVFTSSTVVVTVAIVVAAVVVAASIWHLVLSSATNCYCQYYHQLPRGCKSQVVETYGLLSSCELEICLLLD